MASHGSFPGLPGDGWQQRALPVLAELAAEDARIGGLRVHGSALGTAASPYSPAGITAAIRFYTTTVTDIAVNWDPPPQLDHSPLLELLDAVDLHGAAQ